MIREVIALQDHLGDIQDAEVARAILQDFMAQNAPDQASLSEANLTHITAYLNYRLDEQHNLIATLPEAWARVDSARFRRRLASSLLVI